MMTRSELLDRRLRRHDEQTVPARRLSPAEIASDTLAYLARGGHIDRPAVTSDRCEAAPGTTCQTTRRYVRPVGPASAKSMKRRERVSKAFGGPISLPGSGVGPHPDDL